VCPKGLTKVVEKGAMEEEMGHCFFIEGIAVIAEGIGSALVNVGGIIEWRMVCEKPSDDFAFCSIEAVVF